MTSGVFEDSSVIAGKELTQLANRKRFHLEKAFFAVVVSSIFIFAAFSLGGRFESIAEMAQFGRETFFTLSVLAGIVLPVFAIGASSGIIYSERAGKRLDVLRITPLALSNIILGKGAAILVKSLLVLGLLAPVVAATQFYGGVSGGDIVKAFLIIVSTLVLFTSIGLVVSAGATSNLDRLARSIMWLVAWGFLTGVVVAGSKSLFRLFLGSSLASLGDVWRNIIIMPMAASPPSAWGLLVDGRLPWVLSVFGFFFNVTVGVGLFALSLRNLKRSVARENEMAVEPKVKDFFAGFRRFKGGSKKHKTKGRQREWVSTLVGGAVVQTSMLAVALPLALAVPPLIAMVLLAIARRSVYHERDETMMMLGTALAVVVMIMVAVQAAASIAQEKQRHTAEVIATTPAGGAKMLWWKGSAIVLTQSVAIALCMVMLTSKGAFHARSVAIAARLFGVASMLMLVWALGLSFSVAAKTPFGAGGLYAASVLVLAPVAYYYLPELFLKLGYWPREYAKYASQLIVMGLIAVGVVVSVLRQWFVRPAGVTLAIGVALVLGLGAWLLDFTMGHSYRSQNNFSEIMFLPLWEPRNLQPGAVFILGVYELAFAALLMVGAHYRFTPQLLYGSRSKE